MSFKLDPNFMKSLEADLEPKLERSANSFADSLRENIDAGPRTGRHYPNLPRQSSAPHEYPQRQHGDLYEDVDVGGEGLDRRFGFLKGKNTQAKLSSLEFGSVHMEERAPLGRTAESNDVQKAALEVMSDGAS